MDMRIAPDRNTRRELVYRGPSSKYDSKNDSRSRKSQNTSLFTNLERAVRRNDLGPLPPRLWVECCFVNSLRLWELPEAPMGKIVHEIMVGSTKTMA